MNVVGQAGMFGLAGTAAPATAFVRAIQYMYPVSKKAKVQQSLDGRDTVQFCLDTPKGRE